MRQVVVRMMHLQSGKVEQFQIARDGAIAWIRGFLNQNIAGQSTYAVIGLEELD
jgi:hypothetical protein